MKITLFFLDAGSACADNQSAMQILWTAYNHLRIIDCRRPFGPWEIQLFLPECVLQFSTPGGQGGFVVDHRKDHSLEQPIERRSTITWDLALRGTAKRPTPGLSFVVIIAQLQPSSSPLNTTGKDETMKYRRIFPVTPEDAVHKAN